MCSGVEAEKRVVYACSGCADVGEIADQVARKLRKDGYATPTASCLAGIGAGLKNFVEAAQAAKEVVTIDGCLVYCAKKIIEKIDLAPISIVLTDLGCEKGKTACTEKLVDELAKKIIG
ncbi:MAG: hypothetical protein H6Q73_3738 [Firmicutes bacterium]|nr:hypothetical protein [Bacillota bacterium]